MWVITVYPKKYAHGFVVLCFVVVMQSFIMNSHEVFIHIHQGCFAGTGAIVRLPQCQWSKPDGYGKISQCITTKKHSKAKTVCIFVGIYCTSHRIQLMRLLLYPQMSRKQDDIYSTSKSYAHRSHFVAFWTFCKAYPFYTHYGYYATRTRSTVWMSKCQWGNPDAYITVTS